MDSALSKDQKEIPILSIDQLKIKPEDHYRPSDFELQVVAALYKDYNDFRNNRSISFQQLQNNTPEMFWQKSRELFWNSVKNQSEDLAAMGLDFSIGFARKESLDFLGRLVNLNIKPHFDGNDVNQFGVRTLQAMYNNWRVNTDDKTEKFWQLLYGIVNGTVALNVSYAGENKKIERFLRAYDPVSGASKFEEKDVSGLADVLSNIIPIEELYFASMSERNIQKQGRVIRRQQMEFNRFKYEFKNFPNSQFVYPGSHMDGDSLYLQLLGNNTSDYVEIMYEWNTMLDQYVITAGGIWLNPIGKGKNQKVAPNPFRHKQIPIALAQLRPIDNNFVYGMSLPFEIKDPDRIANTSMTILIERELRISSPPILTSDIEAPDLIFGNNQVVPVSDVDQYKEIQVREPGAGFFTMNTALQNIMSTHAQGGAQNPAPSRQPNAARTDIINEEMRKMYMANTLAMYNNLLIQEVRLVLKTALQFYPTKKFKGQEKNIIHSLMVPDSPLIQGGTGNLEIRIVNKNSDPELLYWEAVNKSVVNGKLTEIIEVPKEVIMDLNVQIGNISLEEEKNTDVEAANFVANILKPMVEVYIPNGLADPAKVFLMHMEALKQHPSDFAPESLLPKLYTLWGEAFQMKFGPDGKPLQAPADVSTPQQGMAAQPGNVLQQQTGIDNGPNGGAGNAGPGPAASGFPQVAPSFGAQQQQ